MDFGITIITTSKETEAALDKVADGVRNRALGKAMNKALTPPLNAARKLAPNRSGLTKKALTKKIKKYSSGTVMGMVGVDAALIGTYKGKKHWPNKIFHFLEEGTKAHKQPRRGNGVTNPGAKARPIIGPVKKSINYEGLAATFASEVQKEIDKLEAK